MKELFLLLFTLCFNITWSQELFVVTEPASNMPSGSIGLRVANSLFKERDFSGYNFHTMPEIMWGVNKSLMVHATAFVSNRNTTLITEGGGLYAKYRFLSIDDVHSHFRMATFGRWSINNSDIHQEEIETMAHNSGYEIGIVGTQLLHKMAISGSLSYEKAIDNGKSNPFPMTQSNSALNYTLSFGQLVYPKTYTSFKQTNINLMLEFLGQRLENKKSFLDIVPSIQFIIHSQARIDLAYRHELYTNMIRTAPNGIYLKFEYTLFNVTN